MALAQPLVSGTDNEWALCRRHKSEKMFGIQLAGGYPNRMVPAAELIGKELKDGVDFVDINLGCPIDLVFNQGAGSACKFFIQLKSVRPVRLDPNWRNEAKKQRSEIKG